MQAFENVSSDHFLFIYIYVYIYIFPVVITSLPWQRSLCNSMKLWAMLWRTTQDTLVVVKSSDKVQSTGGGNDNPRQYSCLENSMCSGKRQKDMTPQGDPLRLEGVQHATGQEQRSSSSRNEEAGPKQKGCSAVGVSGGESKGWCCKEQYNIGT